MTANDLNCLYALPWDKGQGLIFVSKDKVKMSYYAKFNESYDICNRSPSIHHIIVYCLFWYKRVPDSWRSKLSTRLELKLVPLCNQNPERFGSMGHSKDTINSFQ